MTYVKVADRVKAEDSTHKPLVDAQQTPPFAPTTSDTQKDDVGALNETVRGLQAQIDGLKQRSGSTRRDREKNHTVTLRQFELNGEPKGIVTKVSEVKEMKDESETRRFYALCTLEVLDPRTQQKMTYKKVNYLEFMNDGHRINAKVLNWKKDKRYETDPKRGGGGIDTLVKVNPKTGLAESLEEFEFEVGYEDHLFHLKIDEGEYEGLEITVTPLTVNL